MKFLVQSKVLTHLFFAVSISAVLEMNCLTLIEHRGQNIRLLAIEGDSFPKSACNNLAIELVLDSVVKEN